MRDSLTFLCAKIIAYDPGVRQDLLKDSYFLFFVKQLTLTEDNEQIILCTFALSMMGTWPAGRTALLSPNVEKTAGEGGLLNLLKKHLFSNDWKVKQWAALCIAKLWENNEKVKEQAAKQEVPWIFIDLLTGDDPPEVTFCLFCVFLCLVCVVFAYFFFYK